MRRLFVLGVVSLTAALVACRGDAARVDAATAVTTPTASPASAERWTVRVVARYPHDREAFTQGLLWHDGKLYESTGLYGRSSIRRVDLKTGKVEAQAPLQATFLGEGLALVGDDLIQLTWREGRALRWSRDGLARAGESRYDGEGWGLTFDGQHLIQTDGSARLTFRDPATLAVTRTVDVTDAGQPVSLLNELELADGALYANIWTTDEIVRIDPQSGQVTARIDASPLREELMGQGIADDAVLNGIAWRPETKTFLVTGKLWPTLFEVRFVPVG